ncbi:4-hydroxythreonine-4-phosphate dehydrogenase [wastewater metagenome]|uniref:4-hydroxythreonine-4-phosphate dehydrogenase n=3 Tax=root TaxID=1 RepID=A0A5B8RK90_9ZZZZ|nr:4-hydroxythreonine-4-phosphate dehydrogenase [uncultured organism]
MTAPALAVTMGEPAGIGPDLLAMLAANPPADCRPVLVGDPEVIATRARTLGLDIELVPYRPDAPAPDHGLEIEAVAMHKAVTPGRLDPGNATAVLAMLDAALGGCLDGHFAGMVTAPVHKGVINEAGVPFSGHTEYLAHHSGGDLPVMMLVAGGLRVALVTTHLPLREVADAITAGRLERVTRTLEDELRRRFGIAAPRILVAGVNPHAGEGGHLGGEEIEVVTPVLERLRGEGMALTGPLPADTLFTPEHLDHADAVLAMYHDQGLPVLKYAGFGEAVNVTLGLPVVRTSVDHGTALDLAGSGRARDGSLRAAIELATRLATGGGR